MQTERTKKPDVLYDEAVSLFFYDLIDILLEEDYFSYVESALDYVSKMIRFIEKNIHLLPHHTAPHYFSRYKPSMKYITWQPNRRTTWYIFFKQLENRFMIYHITNNHFEGKYIR